MIAEEIFSQRLKMFAVWCALALGSTYLYLFNPAAGAGYPACPFRMITGFQCPGCGSLRGLHQLLHGHPLATFKLNPLLFLTLPFLLYVLFLETRAAITGRRPAKFFIPANLIWTFLGVVLFFWVFRNTSLYPFVS
ncbi:MAG: hypothetical protein QOD75_3621 [Blastocatellia bacterium]|nr:hypothetical protein [Blastocatellia bacterium]